MLKEETRIRIRSNYKRIKECLIKKSCGLFWAMMVLVVLPGSLYANELVVKTMPNSCRDNNIFYAFSNRISPLGFYLFTSENKPIDMADVKLLIDLPEGMEIISYGFFPSENKYYDMVKTPVSDGYTRWTLNTEKTAVTMPFKPTEWTIYSFYHIYVFLKPSPSLKTNKFTLRWKFLGGKLPSEASGTIETQLMPAPKDVKLPRKFMFWTDVGFYSETLDKREINDWLDIMESIGVTHIMQMGLPNKYTKATGINNLYLAEIKKRERFSLVDRDLLTKYINGYFPVRQYPKDDDSYSLDLSNVRAKRMNEQLTNSLLWCPSIFATPGTKVVEMLAQEAKAAHAKGFRYFVIDYEKDIYSICFCSYCRKNFAKYAGLEQEQVMKLAPLDLIYKYPVEWYKFRSWQTGNIFSNFKKTLSADCPDIQLGLDFNLSYPGIFTKGLGYGAIWFSEDARFFDGGVDFQVTDTLKGGMEDIIRIDLLFRPEDSYGVTVKKPIVSRANCNADISWNYFCILGRKAWVETLKKKMGTDKRAELVKLQLGNRAALGVKGVELFMGLDINDAYVVNETAKGMEFVAEFEDFYLSGERLPDVKIPVYDLTKEKSPYHTIGPEGWYDKFFYYGPANLYGFIQYKAHQYQNKVLVSLFNWDLYQEKQVQVKIPDILKGENFYVYLFQDGNRYALSNGSSLLWSKSALQNGISLDVKASALAGVLISPVPVEGYKQTIKDQAYSVAGVPPIDLYKWRIKPVEPDTAGFNQGIYNRSLNGIKKYFPDLIPDRYIK